MLSSEASGRLRYSIEAWREDPGATYRSWFLWEERLKNFRSIRRGIEQVVRQIEDGTFGNVYKGSSLEVAVKSVAEQRQIFKGADHAFLWKPKLRIPDIYEDAGNQLAFGRFLDTCACCSTEEQVLAAIVALDGRKIKGLGPAAANLLYFLHPTIAAPFNTTIVKGYNAVTGSRVKLGSWPDYLAMRAGVLRLNAQHRDLLSNDLGAVAGFLFDVGTGRYPAPPLEGADGISAWERDLAEVREKAAAQTPGRETETDRTHTDMQGLLRDIGLGLGYDVWIASNDRNRAYGGGRLSDGCAGDLRPFDGSAGIDAVRLIDVLWLDKRDGAIHAAFEVEHTTSIYSGIVRMLDLALGPCGNLLKGIFLVAPDGREADVRAQMARPAFAAVVDLDVRYLAYGELERHRESIIRFGEGLKAVRSVSKALP
ncbi:type II restriction endonuclease [Tardiphaga sp. vice352]|uniref:type II restriction endonuclease n=1 Tax=unclassified Tardiphaga TaxID=2631404 RepID=UPI0011657854|nr:MULTISPECIES: type II restriction endonuclease [unclassified Tardiphaga]QDM20586.1 type II restriction endonuclease [Tardiphaga sp. vice154]QDM30929.1 type II restriction endonuclease [Tardiphaga sp. vice352]